MRLSRLQIELRGDAGLVVIGGGQDLDRLDEIDADDERRAAPEDARGIAQETGRLMRLEIADGRAREKADARGRFLGFRRQREACRDVGLDRQHLQFGEVGAQFGRLALDHLAADVDRHIGRELRRRAQQDARFLGGAGAELDQRRAFGDKPADVGGVHAQDAHLAAGRVIFRQFGDALEQQRAGIVVEIFRRQALGRGRQPGQHVGGKGRALLVRRRKLACERTHDASQMNSTRRSPLNCQRAGG